MQLLNPKPEAELVACAASAQAMATIVEQTWEQTRRTPTREEVMQIADGRWDDDFWYIADEADANAGHGNDLDFCDEDNPSGKLSHVKGVCYDIRYAIICKHNHSAAEAGYVAVLGSPTLPPTPIVFGGNPDHKFVKDLTYWQDISTGRDPNLQKWIGR
jgi:hypothetical protein